MAEHLMESAAEAADRLREEGFTLIPLGAPAEAPPEYFIDQRCGGDFNEALLKWPKTPRIQWLEFQHREPSEREWLSWRRQWPTCNYAIVCGRQVNVVDADSQEAMRWIEAGNITRPQRWVDTAKGRHYYYAVSDTVVRNSTGKNKIDLRGQGGYVVAAGSVHLTGVIYTEHVNPAWPDTSPQGLPCLTAADLQAIAAYNAAGQPASNVTQFPVHQSMVGLQAEVGQRNDTIAATVGSLIRRGEPVDAIRSKVHALNGTFSDPLSAAEVDNTLASMLATHIRRNPVLPAPAEEAAPVKDEDFAPIAFDLKPSAQLVPRRWIAGSKAHPEGVATAVVAAGGGAKSSLTIAEAVQFATGRQVLHWQPAGTVSVWMLNLEDPQEEMARRITAVCEHHGISPDELGGRLFANSGLDFERPFVTAEMTRDGAVIHAPVFEAIAKHVKAFGIKVLYVDPFVSSHRVTENDNMAIDAVVKRWSKLAHDLGICVVLVHHTRKTGGKEATAEDTRGGVAIVGAVRLARVLNPMSQKEAEVLGILEDRWRYFRTVDGKSNLTPRTDASTWYRLESVRLNNGDDVGVVTPWKLPDEFADVQTSDLKKVQVRVGIDQWRADPKAKAWIGNLIADVLDLDISDKEARRKVGRIADRWIKGGALETYEGYHNGKNKALFVRCGPSPAEEFDGE